MSDGSSAEQWLGYYLVHVANVTRLLATFLRSSIWRGQQLSFHPKDERVIQLIKRQAGIIGIPASGSVRRRTSSEQISDRARNGRVLSGRTLNPPPTPQLREGICIDAIANFARDRGSTVSLRRLQAIGDRLGPTRVGRDKFWALIESNPRAIEAVFSAQNATSPSEAMNKWIADLKQHESSNPQDNPGGRLILKDLCDSVEGMLADLGMALRDMPGQ